VLVFGQFTMFLLLIAVAYFTAEGFNSASILMTVVFAFVYQTSQGPFNFTYAGTVGNGAQISIGGVTMWSSVLFFSLFTGTLFELLKPYGTYLLFSVCSFVGGVYLVYFMKDAAGLTKEQITDLYVPKDLKLGAETDALLNGTRDTVSSYP